jgi:hypothetical protein
MASRTKYIAIIALLFTWSAICTLLVLFFAGVL